MWIPASILLVSFVFSVLLDDFVFNDMWQTCLKAVTAAVSCIHIVHHRSLLAAVSHSTFCSNVELFRPVSCCIFLNSLSPVQILGMSLWDYGTDVMDAMVGLLVSLV